MKGLFGRIQGHPQKHRKGLRIGPDWGRPAQVWGAGSRVPGCVFKLCGREVELMVGNGSLLSASFKLQGENMGLLLLWSHARGESGVF